MERREPIPYDGKQSRRRSSDDDSNFERVGAFAVAGIGVQDAVVDVVSLPELLTEAVGTESLAQESPVVPVHDAQVVDEEENPALPAGSVVEIMSMQESDPPRSARCGNTKTLLKSRKCRIITALTVALGVGGIVATVLLVQNDFKAANTTPTQALNSTNINETAINEFRAKLKPLLSNESLSALDSRDSPQNQSLQWLSTTPNFQDRPFFQKVQRYAMATIYYATGGPAWSDTGNWLTDETECTWFQGSAGDFCDENRTLHSLNQSLNGLTGKLPDEIRLLTSLKVIDLNYNNLKGSVLVDIFQDLPSSRRVLVPFNKNGIRSFSKASPSDFVSLTALTWLSLDHNLFTGTLPSELGSLTTLTRLTLNHNSFKGSVPSELGSLTALTRLSLDHNFFTGTLSSEFGSLTAMNSLAFAFNSFGGTVPSELGSLTALTWLSLYWNSFTGTLPSEIDTSSNTIFG